ncbi:chemotaxis protein CheW [Pseudidiomarina homiensis]|uniref:chemotaxis protein CheW n=1 Tax=Pseudidiomarina homiensis TaxID=364198 RepID=UPI00215A8B1A|nr:chemotaxis protein CheW [Pseudidiomarina homiensis]
MRISDELRQQLQQRTASFRQRSTEQSESVYDVLSFRIDQEFYALPRATIESVEPILQWTELPGAAAHIRGVAQVRHRVISIVDLRVLFALPQQNLSDKNYVIVISNGQHKFGLLADRIHGVSAWTAAELKPVKALENGIPIDHLAGMFERQNETTLLLDERALITTVMRSN